MSLFKNTAIIFSTTLLLIGCGGGSGGSSNGVTPSYTIGGTVSGLSSSKTVVLQNNAGDNLTVSANGSFTFATSVASGAAYAVTVLTQPSGMTCTVSNGTGTASSNVSNVGVSCQPGVGAFVFTSIFGGNGEVYSAPIDSNGALGQAGLPTSTGTTTLYTSVASPNGKFLYLSSIADGALDHLRGFAIDSNNAALTAINAIPNSADPVYGLAIHPSGNYLYASGSTSNYSNDFVQAYQVNNQTGGLTPIGQQLAGAGQYNRAVAITPSGNLVFTIAEVNGLTTAYITSYGVGNDGALTRIGQPLAVTDGGTHICPNDVVVDSTGSYAYFVSYDAGNNWGCINAIYGFRINADGSLSAIGSTQFASVATDSSKLTASPTAGFIYLPDSLSGNIYAFRINAATGALTPVGSQPTNVSGGPVDVAIDATGRHAYVSTYNTNSIITLSIDQTTGALTNPRTTSLPPPAGGGLYAITVAPKQ